VAEKVGIGNDLFGKTAIKTEDAIDTGYVHAAIETEESESSGSGKTIIIVLVVVVLLVGVGVTIYAQQNKILCFEETTDDDEEAAGQQPLLAGATSVSKLSPSRATTASGTTLDKSRQSATTVSGDR